MNIYLQNILHQFISFCVSFLIIHIHTLLESDDTVAEVSIKQDCLCFISNGFLITSDIQSHMIYVYHNDKQIFKAKLLDE